MKMLIYQVNIRSRQMCYYIRALLDLIIVIVTLVCLPRRRYYSIICSYCATDNKKGYHFVWIKGLQVRKPKHAKDLSY